LNQQDQERNQHDVTGRCKIETECPEWDLQNIGQGYLFDQDESEMVDDKYHPGKIEKSNPEEKLT
jgi:hypothetical protein